MIGRRGAALAVAAAMVLSAAGVVRAQALSETIIASSSALSSGQVEAVEQFVEGAVGRLIAAGGAGDAEAMRGARQQLIGPLVNPNASEQFLLIYPSALASGLERALAADEPVWVRLNGMIAASQIRRRPAMALVELGLSDPSSAVRYYAAKTAANMLPLEPGATRLTPADQTALLALLEPRLVTESEEQVFRQMAQAIVNMDIPLSSPALLAGLNARVGRYATRPNVDASGVFEAIRQQATKLVQRSGDGGAPAAVVRQLLTVCVRYLTVAARHGGTSGPEMDERSAHWRAVAEQADETLRHFVPRLGSQATLPSPAVRDLPWSSPQQAWAIVGPMPNSWRSIVTQAPIGLSASDLEVNFEANEAGSNSR